VALIYLIRHPHTRINLETPAATWDLSEIGQAQTAALLNAPFWPHVSAVYPSREPKAVTTAKEAALRYNIPVVPRSAFGELDRSAYTAPDERAYEVAVAACFATPAESPHGWEPAAAALFRFKREMAQVLSWHPPEESIAVVSHGLVLALYMAHLRGQEPTLSAWRAVDFAAIAAVDRASLRPVSAFLTAPYPNLPLP